MVKKRAFVLLFLSALLITGLFRSTQPGGQRGFSRRQICFDRLDPAPPGNGMQR